MMLAHYEALSGSTISIQALLIYWTGLWAASEWGTITSRYPIPCIVSHEESGKKLWIHLGSLGKRRNGGARAINIEFQSNFSQYAKWNTKDAEMFVDDVAAPKIYEILCVILSLTVFCNYHETILQHLFKVFPFFIPFCVPSIRQKVQQL